MGEMWDAVTWQNLTGKAGAKAGYRDGAKSQWPAEAWVVLAPGPFLNITVLADERWEAYDSEVGDAPPGQVATAVANRLQQGKWSVIYTNQAGIGQQTSYLSLKGVHWTSAEFWPEPGVYLWAADPSGNIKAGRWHPPVTPIAVQDAWEVTVDHSTTVGEFPAVSGAPIPAPPAHEGKLSAPIVGGFAHPDGAGYWLVGADGGVFAFGSAKYYGGLA